MNKEIYKILQFRILYLEYPPGEILRESDLANEFGISKSPLRTVLLRLEWEGLVKILPRAGIMVRELDLPTLTEVYQARLEVEGAIGALAASNFTETEFKKLDELTGACRKFTGRQEPKALVALDIQIKQFFCAAARNTYLAEMSNQLYHLTLRLWFFNLLKMDMDEWNLQVKEMADELVYLSGFLKQKSPDQVCQARKKCLVEHMEHIRSKFLQVTLN